MTFRDPSRRKLIRLAAALCVVAASAAALAWTTGGDGASGLPDYKPSVHLDGVIRLSGNDKMGPLMQAWEEGFRKYHPEIRFAGDLKGTASGLYGLEMRTADIALMGRAMNPFERYGTYERSWTYPVEIEVATGNADRAHHSDALAVFVHKDNPLARLSLKQLDGIFGAARGGGWKALSWDEASARSAKDDIRSWDQLDMPADWRGKPIHPYGPPILGAGTISFFQAKVMGGGAMWNEELQEFGDRRQMLDALSRDPYGIAYAPAGYANPGVKMVALAEIDGGPYRLPTKEFVRDRGYPLARPIYLTFTIDNTHSEIADPRIDPKVAEFLRFVLSRQGQQIVGRQGDYLPLPGPVADLQLQLLDAKGIPPERELLVD